MGFNSKYKSGKSVGKNQTVPINVDDPRLKPGKIGQTKARQGAEIDIIGLDGKALITGGRNVNSPSGGIVPTPSGPPVLDVLTPPINNQPPQVYPGGSGPVIIVPTDPTNVVATWSENSLIITFDWDYNNPVNSTVSQFIVELISEGIIKRTSTNSFIPNKTQTAQTITVSKSIITSMFNVFTTNFSSICVLSGDPLNNISNTICAATLPTYALDLPVPVINVASITSGYSVSYTTPTQDSFDAIEVVEYESTSSTEPTGVTYARTFFDTLNPAIIISPNFNKRWVKARFSSDSGTYTAYSAAQAVTPTVVGLVDLIPPNEVDSASATWSGDNIVVSYTLPSTDPATRIKIQLTSPNLLVGYFYSFPVGSGTSQTTTITKRDLLEQFGQHYSSFAGILISIDSSDNRSSGVSFNVGTRINPLLGIIPTFTATPLTNGYSIFANNYESSVGVTYMQVHAKHSEWLANPTNEDNLVYAGSNPAVIIDDEYTPVYIKIIYYDDFNQTSSFSNQANNSVTPLDAGIVTSFENPITFGVNGVIYAGVNYNSGNRTLFKTGGIFAYDAVNTSPSTQIVSNAAAGTPTFITRQAQIADWNITSSKIENDLSGPPTSYTGLSATGTYSFWAGSAVSGGNETSKFTVTPAGEVTAREITILGNGSPSTDLISAGSFFTVKNDGSVTATSANIQGVLKADSGEFLGNVLIQSSGSLYSPKISGTVPAPGIAGVIFDNDAISAFGTSSSSYTQMYSTPLLDGSTFKTTAANIGGWIVSSSKISKTGVGILSLDSANGYISVSSDNVSTYTAGINSANTLTDVAFWSGTATKVVGAETVPDPGKQTVVSTTATGAISTRTITVASTTNIAIGLRVAGTGIGSGAIVTGIAGTVITLSVTNTSAVSGTITFSKYTNSFVVRMDGTLFASGAQITGGVISSTGTLGSVVMDGDKGLMSLSTESKTSYLMPRNGNIYLTAPGTALPWGTDNGSGGVYTTPPTDQPYFVAGSAFKNPWNAASSGIGMFVGAWDYFSTGSSNPFITLTKNNTTSKGVIQLSASPKIGVLIEEGGSGGEFTDPTMLIYTANNGAGSNYSPSTTFGAYAKFQENLIKLSASSTTFIDISGVTGNKKITLQASASSDSTDSPYISSSKIVLSDSKVQIFGLTALGNADIVKRTGGTNPNNPSDPQNGNYRTGINGENLYPLGANGRQRTIIQSEYTGELLRGMAVYYASTTEMGATTAPSSSAGVVGDLWVVY